MAKPPRRSGLAAAVGLAALAMAQPSRADWQVTPRLTVRETYTDNVLLQPKEQARSQFVTEASPGLAVAHTGPRLELTGAYSKQFYKYADEDVGGANGANNSQQQLTASMHAKLLEESLFLDSSASISQQGTSAFGPVPTASNGYAPGLTNEVKVYRISPYLVQRFGSVARAEVRYSRDRVSTDNVNFGTSNSDTLTVNLASGQSARQLGWGLYYSRQNVSDTLAQGSSSENLSLSGQYRYSNQLSLSVNAGYDKYDYNSLGGRTKGKSWSVGGVWRPSERTSVQGSLGKRYFGDSYSLVAMHRTRASVWSVNYSDAVTTTRSQFTLPSAVDTFNLIDQMFQSAIPDAAARRQAVLAYIQQAGLPPSLANSINYLSNRYMLQKQFQASAAFNSPRASLILTLFDSRRTGLSLVDVDAGLLGSSTNALNDNTHQTGGTATYNWRLSPRSSINFGLNYNKARSLSADRGDNNTAYRINLMHEFAHKLQGNVEVRHVKGATAVAGRDYTENALSASLSKQF
jgi:uncharacterized protein (PEP-CTERM system associated)